VAQLWHIGLWLRPGGPVDATVRLVGPSGFDAKGNRVAEPMSESEIEEMFAAYRTSAALAKSAGFDGIELHGAHGYLIDQFFWHVTNRRTDGWGGGLAQRTRFAVGVIRACRDAVGPDFPICLRFSQWKIEDYAARLVETPAELERFLAPLVDAGVDLFHCSTRRFWEPEFEGSDLGLAGWTKKLTGLPTIAVGSVTLSQDVTDRTGVARPTGIARLLDLMDRGDFDLVAVGRALIADPHWPRKVARGEIESLQPFTNDLTKTLY
jgi:2,4-dienoyl-CoA reductase-like NADH-dependent reductase (Old Yellow Enzyme family)